MSGHEVSYHTQASVVRDQNARLERELAELQAEASGLRACLDATQNDNESVEVSAVALGTRAMQLVSSGARVMQERARDLENSVVRVGNARSSADAQLETLEKQLSAVQRDVAQLSQQLLGREKEQQRLDTQHAREQKQLAQRAKETRALVRAAEEDLRRSERDLEQRAARVTELKRALQATDEELVSSRADAVGQQAVLGQLKQQQHDVDSHLAASVTKLEDEDRKVYALEDRADWRRYEQSPSPWVSSAHGSRPADAGPRYRESPGTARRWQER